MLNKVILIGRLTRANELRHSENQKSYMYNIIAVNDNFNKEKVSFIPIVIFGKTAELTFDYTNKGDLISIEGRLEVINKKDENGNYQQRSQVVVSNVFFLSNKKNSSDKEELNDFESFELKV